MLNADPDCLVKLTQTSLEDERRVLGDKLGSLGHMVYYQKPIISSIKTFLNGKNEEL